MAPRRMTLGARSLALLCGCSLLGTAAGCTLATVRPAPSERPVTGPVECDEDSSLLMWEGGLGSVLLGLGVAGAIGGAAPGDAAVVAGTGAAMFVAALITQSDLRRCREAKACVAGDAAACVKLGWPTGPPKSAPLPDPGPPRSSD